MKVLTVDQMRRAEQECSRLGLPTSKLMENAGLAVAEEVRRILGAVDRQPILVLIGPGNNGGDGLVAARHLHDWGADVNLYLVGKRPDDDPNFELVRQRGITCVEGIQDKDLNRLDDLLPAATAVIDALLGTGKSRPLGDAFRRVLQRVNETRNKRHGLTVVALDLPSGLNADSGAIDPDCPYADYTVTLGFPKPGLFLPPGIERVGKIIVADIGIPSHLAESVTTELITDDLARSMLPQRPLAANKGTFGRVMVVAGSIHYTGAACLAGSGALRAGAGLVTLAAPASLQPVLAAALTEATHLPLPESAPGIIAESAASLICRQLSNYNVLLLGCGLGQSPAATGFIRSVLFRLPAAPLSVILDADALNALAKTPDWWQRLAGDAILTPHPGEMSRLAGVSLAEVQSDRLGIARKAAQEWRKTVVLKGAFTVIANPDGQLSISPVANPGLASAGTGDVLSGVIAGLAAQGLSLAEAASCGVYLHGQAGEVVRERLGDAGMLATDLLPALPLVVKRLKEPPKKPDRGHRPTGNGFRDEPAENKKRYI